MRRLWKKIFSLKTTALLLVAVVWAYAALRVYRAWVKDDRVAAQHYSNAVDLKHEGKLDEAEAELKAAIDLSVTDSPEFYVALGYHYSSTNRCSKAIDHYRKAIAIDGKYEPLLLHGIAWCYAQMGHAREAITTLTHLKNDYPSTFNHRHAEFLHMLQYETRVSYDRGKRTVHFLFETPADWKDISTARMLGNWKEDGTQSDAYGYKAIPMQRKAGHRWEASASLYVKSDFPYVVMVKDTQDRMFGIAYFRLNPEQDSTAYVSIRPTLNTAYYGLRKYSTLHSRKKGQDGRQRIFILWPDGGSWWLLRSLIERGLAPNAREVLAKGAHAEMISEPPLTSIAIQRLTSFEKKPSWSAAFWIQMKAAIPFLDPLIHVEQGGQLSLAEKLRSKHTSFADLTYDEPYLISGGEQRMRRKAPPIDEHQTPEFDPVRTTIPTDSVAYEYLDVPKIQGFIQNRNLFGKWLLATQWDATETKFRRAASLFEGEESPQVLFLCLPAFDSLSHYFFENTESYSERMLLLESFYVYLDDLIGRARSLLDEDDTLLVISDHGMLDTYQHHKAALFLMEGPPARPGESLNPFPIAHFPHLITHLTTNGALSFQPVL